MRSKNLGALLVAGALLSLVVTPIATATDDLTLTFKHGAPEDPAWTMYKLEVTQPGVKPTMFVDFAFQGCPIYWSFQFLKPSADGPVVYNGVGFNFGNGYSGVDASSEGTPLAISTIHNDGAKGCFTLDWTIEFGALPLGTVYFRQARAGAHIDATATITFGPGVSLVDQSEGFTGYYVAGHEFEGGTHAQALSPRVCSLPSVSPSGVGCEVEQQAGLQGADVSLDRHTELTFEHRPMFLFANKGSVQASNASVTDPVGTVVTNSRFADATVAGISVLPGEIMSTSANLPSGTYSFAIDKSASVGALNSAAWYLVAFDFELPEDQA